METPKHLTNDELQLLLGVLLLGVVSLGGPGPAAGAVRLAGLTALPSPGPCTRRLRGGHSTVGTYRRPSSRVKGPRSGAASRRPRPARPFVGPAIPAARAG